MVVKQHNNHQPIECVEVVGERVGGAQRKNRYDASSRLVTNIPITGFGHVRVVEETLLIQLDAVSLLTTGLRPRTKGTGTAGKDAEGHFSVTAPADGDVAELASSRPARYRPGQTLTAQFTAAFEDGVANTEMWAGFFSDFASLEVGRKDGVYGCRLTTKGLFEIRRLTIATPASGSGDVTITLDSVAYVIPVTAGTAAANGNTIQNWFAANVDPLWDWRAYQNGATVTFVAKESGVRDGTYSVSATAAAFAGSIDQIQAGRDIIEDFVPQADFNVDKLDPVAYPDASPSGLQIDPFYTNVYEVHMKYLGDGTIRFSVEHADADEFVTFHVYRFSSRTRETNVSNPTMRIGYRCSNSSGGPANIGVLGASMKAALDGKFQIQSEPRSKAVSAAGVGTTELSLFALRVREEVLGKQIINEVLPRFVTVTTEGSTYLFSVWRNPVFATPQNWSYVDVSNSIVEESDVVSQISGGRLVYRTAARDASAESQALKELGANDVIGALVAQPGDVLAFTAQKVGTGGVADVHITTTWVEDIT